MSTSENPKYNKAEYNKAWRKKKYHSNPEFKRKLLAENWAYRTADPVRAAQRRRDHKLMAKYGITEADYLCLLEAQGGKCYLCRQVDPKKRLHVDHCHKTGVVRGLLCMFCNHALGVVEKRKWNLLNLYLLLGPNPKPGIGATIVAPLPVFSWKPNPNVAL